MELPTIEKLREERKEEYQNSCHIDDALEKLLKDAESMKRKPSVTPEVLEPEPERKSNDTLDLFESLGEGLELVGNCVKRLSQLIKAHT
jgi:hypothetical protein